MLKMNIPVRNLPFQNRYNLNPRRLLGSDCPLAFSKQHDGECGDKQKGGERGKDER